MNVPFTDLTHYLFIFIFLGEEGEDNCDYVAVFLTSRLQGDLDVKYDFSVLKSDNTCWGRIGNTFKKFCPDQNSWGYGKAFSKAKLMEKQNELLPNGCLTIVCNLEIFYSDKTTQGRVSERMSCYDLAIFFCKSSAYIPHFRENHSTFPSIATKNSDLKEVIFEVIEAAQRYPISFKISQPFHLLQQKIVT